MGLWAEEDDQAKILTEEKAFQRESVFSFGLCSSEYLCFFCDLKNCISEKSRLFFITLGYIMKFFNLNF